MKLASGSIARPALARWLGIAAIAMLSAICSADTINTAQIVARSHSIDCLDWKVKGLCFWLKCTLFGCRVVTTPKISHRLPDFVVAAYPQTGDTPWVEINPIVAAVAPLNRNSLSGGNLAGVGSGRRHQDAVIFNETDVVGNPALKLVDFGRFLCKSDARPMHLYYLSILDFAAWRSGGQDVLRKESVTPGVREIGNWPRSTWGSVYPRSGFIVQTDPAKAAAVTSQRAIDIVTRDGSGHIHRANPKRQQFDVVRGNPAARNKPQCARSGGAWKMETRNRPAHCKAQTWRQWVSAADEKKVHWQMLHPATDNRCEAFGAEGDWSKGKISDSGSYAWNYWRTYECCIKAGGAFLKSVNF